MKYAITMIFCTLLACINKSKTDDQKQENLAIKGTWKLLSGTLIEKGDTTVTDYTQKTSFVKIINDTHFAFLSHDLVKGKDSSSAYSSGGGKYEIKGSKYTEHLEYCTAREWEGNNFDFEVTIKNDTLVQQGVEIIEKEGINRMNIERYVRVKE